MAATKRFLPKRRVSLARELSESCRVGPRVWSLVGLAFLLTALFEKFVWLAIILWLLFVLREVLFGMIGWVMGECIRWIAAARAMPRNSSSGEASSSAPPVSARGIIDVRAEEVVMTPRRTAAAPSGSAMRP